MWGMEMKITNRIVFLKRFKYKKRKIKIVARGGILKCGKKFFFFFNRSGLEYV